MKNTKELTARQAACELGCSLYFVYCQLWTGKLPGRKVGKQWRIPASVVEEYLTQRAK